MVGSCLSVGTSIFVGVESAESEQIDHLHVHLFLCGNEAADELSGFVVYVWKQEVETEIHVAELARDVQHAHYLHLARRTEGGRGGGEVAQWYGIDGVPTDEMDVGIERIAVEDNIAAWLEFEIAIDDILQIETVFASLYLIDSVECERTLVVVVGTP